MADWGKQGVLPSLRQNVELASSLELPFRVQLPWGANTAVFATSRGIFAQSVSRQTRGPVSVGPVERTSVFDTSASGHMAVAQDGHVNIYTIGNTRHTQDTKYDEATLEPIGSVAKYSQSCRTASAICMSPNDQDVVLALDTEHTTTINVVSMVHPNKDPKTGLYTPIYAKTVGGQCGRDICHAPGNPNILMVMSRNANLHVFDIRMSATVAPRYHGRPTSDPGPASVPKCDVTTIMATNGNQVAYAYTPTPIVPPRYCSNPLTTHVTVADIRMGSDALIHSKRVFDLPRGSHVVDMALDPTFRWLTAASNDGHLFVDDLVCKTPSPRVVQVGHEASALAVTADGSHVAVATRHPTKGPCLAFYDIPIC